jgi:hypothetical protein
MVCYLVIGGGIGGVTATGARTGGSVINLGAITLFELWRFIKMDREWYRFWDQQWYRFRLEADRKRWVIRDLYAMGA